MLVISDRVKESSISEGSGSLTLEAPFGSFQSFSQGVGNGNTTYYCIENGTRWEVGQGVYTSAGNTLSRDVVFDSSAGGAKINLEGASVVFCTLPADRAIYQNENGHTFVSGISTLQLNASGVEAQNLSVSGQVEMQEVTISGDLSLLGNFIYNSDLANINRITTSGDIHSSGFLTLVRPLGDEGNFLHAYKNDGTRQTIALHVDNQISPLWKFGLKTNPNNEQDPPTFGYVFARDGSAGIVGDLDNYVSISDGLGFTVQNESHNVLRVSSLTGIYLETNSSVNPSFVITGPPLNAEDLTQWRQSDDTILSVVDSGGKFGILRDNPEYEIDVNGSGRMESIHLTSGIYFQDNTFQSTAAFGNAFDVSGWADATMTTRDNAVSGWADTTITNASGWASTTITNGDNAVSGYFQTYTDNQDAAISGIAVYASGHNLQSVTDNGNTTTNDIYTSGLLFASGNVFGASGCFQAIDFEIGVNAGYKEGRIFYDNANHALAVYNDESEITLQVGQEEYIRVRNNSGSDIGNGKAVFITGSQGTHTTVELGIASGELQSEVIGLATHDIGNNEFGYITTFGLVRGLDTSSFTEGDEVFLDAATNGELTNVAPLAPNYKTPIGHIVRSHPSQGSILVTPRDHKLGGGDIKTFGQIQESGIPFIDLTTENSTQIRAGILASDPSFYYDSGNYRLHISAGGIRFSDGTTQTTASASSTYTAGSGLTLQGDEFNVYGGSGHFINLEVENDVASNIPLVVIAATSQSANIQEWQDSSFNTLASIGPLGDATFGGDMTLSAINADLYVGQAGVGAPKIYVREHNVMTIYAGRPHIPNYLLVGTIGNVSDSAAFINTNLSATANGISARASSAGFPYFLRLLPYGAGSDLFSVDNVGSISTSGMITVASGIRFNDGTIQTTAGGGNRAYNNITADFSMSDTSDVVFMDTTSGPINVYLPTAVGQGGKEMLVKLKAGNNSGVLIGSGAQTIDGQSQFGVYNTHESITLISDNSNWFIS